MDSTSRLLGLPPYVSDPQDLSNSSNPFPDSIGSQFRYIDEETLLKYGFGVSLAEAEAMDFVSSHTSIKCPKVIGAYVLNGKGHIMMPYEQGDYVGGFNRNPCVADEFEWDSPQSDYKYGPYPDEYGFNEGIMEAISRASPLPPRTDPESAGYNNMYATRQLVHSLRGHEVVFAHGDLNAGNILIRDDLTVVILDWCTASFYPAYWEWYKAT
ncbi:kinase-like protein [Xylaria castorea]|nr:kinase-like protein [Xylaria castorea]